MLPDEIYVASHSGFTGDVSVGALGWMNDCVVSPWRISSSDAAKITVLSVTMYGYYTV